MASRIQFGQRSVPLRHFQNAFCGNAVPRAEGGLQKSVSNGGRSAGVCSLSRVSHAEHAHARAAARRAGHPLNQTGQWALPLCCLCGHDMKPALSRAMLVRLKELGFLPYSLQQHSEE